MSEGWLSNVFSLSAIAVVASELLVNAWMHFDPTGVALTAKVAHALGFTGAGSAGAAVATSAGLVPVIN